MSEKIEALKNQIAKFDSDAETLKSRIDSLRGQLGGLVIEHLDSQSESARKKFQTALADLELFKMELIEVEKRRDESTKVLTALERYEIRMGMAHVAAKPLPPIPQYQIDPKNLPRPKVRPKP